MKLFDLVSRDNLDAALNDKLITVRDDGQNQRILNYSDAALYTAGAWGNPAVRTCRGLIVNDQDDVVARPWAKFFNHGQAEAGDLDLGAPVEVTDKLDGSLGILHLDSTGAPRIATRGSFFSDQAIHATELLRERYSDLRVNLDQVTPLFEIVYPANRIVVNYGDRDDLILLGGVDIETGEYLSPSQVALEIGWNGPKTQVFGYKTLHDALAAPTRPGMEGLCVRFLSEPRIVKIKQDDYVRLHRIVTGLSERTVWEHMGEGKPLDDLLGPLPDELHQWTRDVWGGLLHQLAAVHETATAAHRDILDDLGSDFERRDYALRAQEHAHLRPYLFNLLDGRDPTPAILRTLKPAGDTRAKTISEATA